MPSPAPSLLLVGSDLYHPWTEIANLENTYGTVLPPIAVLAPQLQSTKARVMAYARTHTGGLGLFSMKPAVTRLYSRFTSGNLQQHNQWGT